MENRFYSVFIGFLIIASLNFVNGKTHEQYQLERKKINAFVRENCTEVSTDSYYITRAIRRSTTCTDLEGFGMAIGMGNFQTVEAIGSMFNSSCYDHGYLNSTLRCFDENVQVYNGCLSEQEKVKTMTYRRMLNRFINFMCLEDGYKVARVIAAMNAICIRNVYESLEQCIETAKDHYSDLRIPFSFINDNNCRDLIGLKACMVPLPNACEDQIIADYIESFINHMMDELSCEARVMPKNFIIFVLNLINYIIIF